MKEILKVKVKRKLALQAGPGSRVYLAGCFNGWREEEIPLTETAPGSFEVTIDLEPGVYQYKFIVDGQWTLDPENPNITVNGMGTLNSLLKVEEPGI